MLRYFLPIILIIGSGILYNLSTKMIPSDANPFIALFVTYLTAMILSVVLYLFYPSEQPLLASVKQINWTSFLLGLSIVGLEFGYLIAYRLGWAVSITSVTANIGIAIAMIPIGLLFFSDHFTIQRAVGLILCLGGLFLITRK